MRLCGHQGPATSRSCDKNHHLSWIQSTVFGHAGDVHTGKYYAAPADCITALAACTPPGTTACVQRVGGCPLAVCMRPVAPWSRCTTGHTRTPPPQTQPRSVTHSHWCCYVGLVCQFSTRCYINLSIIRKTEADLQKVSLPILKSAEGKRNIIFVLFQIIKKSKLGNVCSFTFEWILKTW